MSLKVLRSYRPSILVYHHIYGSGEGCGRQAADSVALADFERQMGLLRERFTVLPLRAVLAAIGAGVELPGRTVVITFDDGYRSTYTRALPVLLEHGLSSCVFLATGLIGRPAFDWLPPSGDGDGRPMSWPEATSLLSSGMEIGSHTATHRFPPRMSGSELESELVRSGREIAEETGHVPNAIALPFSFPLVHRSWPAFEDALVAGLKRASYTCCCTLQRGAVRRREGITFLPRVCVTGSDTMRTFQAKASGLYRYTDLAQRVYQAYFKRYGG